MKIREKIAKKLIEWLLHYVPEWTILDKLDWEDTENQLDSLKVENTRCKCAVKSALSVLERADADNKRLRAENQMLREEAKAFADQDLAAENERLRAEAAGARGAYNALIEEMEGQLHG